MRDDMLQKFSAPCKAGQRCPSSLSKSTVDSDPPPLYSQCPCLCILLTAVTRSRRNLRQVLNVQRNFNRSRGHPDRFQYQFEKDQKCFPLPRSHEGPPHPPLPPRLHTSRSGLYLRHCCRSHLHMTSSLSCSLKRNVRCQVIPLSVKEENTNWRKKKKIPGEQLQRDHIRRQRC